MTLSRRGMLGAGGRTLLLLTGLPSLSATATGRVVPASSARPPAAIGQSVPNPAAPARTDHFPFGPVVPPRPVTAWPVVTQLGVHTDLATLLQGKVSALQLMFTGCSATCPIQGALFAQAQRDLRLRASGPSAQFISISIDPLSDRPAALAAWLRQFSAQPGWTAAAPRVTDLTALVAWLSVGGEPLPPTAEDPHTGQVYLTDPRGNLVHRLPSMPSARSIVGAMAGVARRS